MNKKLLIKIAMAVILVIIVSVGGYFFYKDYQVRHAVKIVELKSDKVEVYSEVKLSDLISKINGRLISDKKIDTSKLGKKDISFKYINDDNIKVDYTISIEVSDMTPPLIYQNGVYTVNAGYDGDIAKDLFCGDNYDDNPTCSIEGEYDLNTIGKYDLTFVGVDKSGNKASHDFTLNVRKKPSGGGGSSASISGVEFSDIVKEYKNENTKIGLDISHWQGDIDFDRVKESGVEFVYIRVGRGDGIGGDYVLDKKFEQNIKGFNRVGIPVGVYFYSYANSKEDASKEAKWVLKQIKDYKVDLEIGFDWENWSSFQEFDLSFKKLTEVAEAFSKTVKAKGYTGMLYSSKSYLESVWYPVNFPVWLAHYTKKTSYTGRYKVWQICNDGRVDGIDDNLVDINIMYK